MLGRSAPKARFIAFAKIQTASTMTLSYPPGTLAGDLCILFLNRLNNPSTDVLTGLTGWVDVADMVTTNPGSSTQGPRVYWKVLTSADIATPATVVGAANAGSTMTAVYRDASSVALIGALVHSAQTASTVTSVGTTTGLSKGSVILVSDRDFGVAAGTANQNFVFRGSSYIAESEWTGHLFDELLGTYPSGATVTMGGFVTPNEQMCVMLELR